MNKIKLNKEDIFPSKVVCIGRNYIDHIKELNNEIPKENVFFFKVNSTICDKLIFPKKFKECHYEAELSFLIKNNKIVAVAFGLDLTLRHIQSKLKQKGLPWERAKAFDNSAVFSEFITFNKDINKLGIELYINKKLRQKADVSLMINKPDDIIQEILTFCSFEDGDILMSGTPSGVGTLNIGDIFDCRILYEDTLLLEHSFVVS